MAMTSGWDDVLEQLRVYDDLRVYQPTLAAQRRLVTALREDSRLADVEPGLAHATLILRLRNHKRGVMVAWNDDAEGYKVGIIDPLMEVSDIKLVPPTEVGATILDYLEQLRRIS